MIRNKDLKDSLDSHDDVLQEILKKLDKLQKSIDDNKKIDKQQSDDIKKLDTMMKSNVNNEEVKTKKVSEELDKGSALLYSKYTVIDTLTGTVGYYNSYRDIENHLPISNSAAYNASKKGNLVKGRYLVKCLDVTPEDVSAYKNKKQGISEPTSDLAHHGIVITD